MHTLPAPSAPARSVQRRGWLLCTAPQCQLACRQVIRAIPQPAHGTQQNRQGWADWHAGAGAAHLAQVGSEGHHLALISVLQPLEDDLRSSGRAGGGAEAAGAFAPFWAAWTGALMPAGGSRMGSRSEGRGQDAVHAAPIKVHATYGWALRQQANQVSLRHGTGSASMPVGATMCQRSHSSCHCEPKCINTGWLHTASRADPKPHSRKCPGLQPGGHSS